MSASGQPVRAMSATDPKDLPPLQFAARVAGGVAVLAASLWLVRGFLPALAWAVVIGIATMPLLRGLEVRLRGDGPWRGLLPLLLTSLVAAALIIPLTLAAVQAGREIQVLAHWLIQGRQEGFAPPDWLVRIPLAGDRLLAFWREHLADPAALAEWTGRWESSRWLEASRVLGQGLAARLATLAFTLVALYFVYRDGEALGGAALDAAERVFGPTGRRYGADAARAVRATVNGLVLVALGEGILLGVAYAACGLPHAALLGAATGLFAVVPFAAPLIFTGAAVVLFAQGATLTAGGLLVFGMAVLTIGDHAVRPALISGSVRLPFLWVLLGILGGVEHLGLLGLFLGPALLAAAVAVWRDLSVPPRED